MLQSHRGEWCHFPTRLVLSWPLRQVYWSLRSRSATIQTRWEEQKEKRGQIWIALFRFLQADFREAGTGGRLVRQHIPDQKEPWVQLLIAPLGNWGSSTSTENFSNLLSHFIQQFRSYTHCIGYTRCHLKHIHMLAAKTFRQTEFGLQSGGSTPPGTSIEIAEQLDVVSLCERKKCLE